MKTNWLAGVGGCAIFLALWELLIAAGLAQFEYLPPPSSIASALTAMVRDPSVYSELAHTATVTLLGWLISAAIGVTLGTILGISPGLRRYSLASVEVLRPLPGIAFLPLALLLFGFSIATELLVVVIPAVWPVLVNTMGGVSAVPARLHEVARTFRMSKIDSALKVFAPAAAASILVGLRLAMSLSLILAIAAEMIGNPAGLGYALVREAQALHPDAMFGYVALIGALGILLNGVLVALAKLALPGEFRRPSHSGSGPA